MMDEKGGKEQGIVKEEVVFCSKFIPVKREFFLVTVTLVLNLGGSGSGLCQAP